jgi:hypothetical protein
MSTVPDDPEFADPGAVHPLLPARTRWPERDLPPPPRLPAWTAPDHRMAHVAIAMGALLLCVSAWTNGLLVLSSFDASLPPRFGSRGEELYDPAQDAETVRLFVLSLAAHGTTLVFLALASLTGGRGHRTTSVILFLPLVFGVLIAMSGGTNALERVGL